MLGSLYGSIQIKSHSHSKAWSQKRKARSKKLKQSRKAAGPKGQAETESETFHHSSAKHTRQLSTLPAIRNPATHTPILDPILASRKLNNVRETRLRYQPRTVPASSRSDMKSL